MRKSRFHQKLSCRQNLNVLHEASKLWHINFFFLQTTLWLNLAFFGLKVKFMSNIEM